MWEVGLWGSKNVGSGTLGSKKCGKWDFQDAVSPPPPPLYRPLYSYRAVITWVYIGFVNGGFEILRCEYLWVATFPCGGFGDENLEIRSALGAILGIF